MRAQGVGPRPGVAVIISTLAFLDIFLILEGDTVGTLD
jgi:hypothetical protein